MLTFWTDRDGTFVAIDRSGRLARLGVGTSKEGARAALQTTLMHSAGGTAEHDAIVWASRKGWLTRPEAFHPEAIV